MGTTWDQEFALLAAIDANLSHVESMARILGRPSIVNAATDLRSKTAVLMRPCLHHVEEGLAKQVRDAFAAERPKDPTP